MGETSSAGAEGRSKLGCTTDTAAAKTPAGASKAVVEDETAQAAAAEQGTAPP